MQEETQMRDMTQQQFRDALLRHGMKEMGFMGYVNVNVPGHHLEVSKYNAGTNRRAQLAYLLKCRDREMKECVCGHMKIDHGRPIRDEAKKIVGWKCGSCGPNDCAGRIFTLEGRWIRYLEFSCTTNKTRRTIGAIKSTQGPRNED
jgi:hypothetical protein